MKKSILNSRKVRRQEHTAETGNAVRGKPPVSYSMSEKAGYFLFK